MRSTFIYGKVVWELIKSIKVLRKKTELHVAKSYAKERATAFLEQIDVDIHIKGKENIPQSPVIYVCNHQSYADVPVLYASLPGYFGFIAKQEVKKVPILGSWLDQLECVCIDRKNGRKAFRVLEEDAKGKIDKGNSLLIFPEGTRSLTGEILPFKRGVVTLAKKTGAPIVPVVMDGCQNILKRGEWDVRRGGVTIEVLPPLLQETYQDIGDKDLTKQLQNMFEEALKKQRAK